MGLAPSSDIITSGLNWILQGFAFQNDGRKLKIRPHARPDFFLSIISLLMAVAVVRTDGHDVEFGGCFVFARYFEFDHG